MHWHVQRIVKQLLEVGDYGIRVTHLFGQLINGIFPACI